MDAAVEFLLRHGYSLLFVFVFAEQAGLPIPATPLLLAAGALAGLGHLNLLLAWLLAVLACLLGDSLWFYLGKTRGMSILRVLCKVSLEPDTCVRKTKLSYNTHGAKWLLFAKFVPGLSTIAPPMAGMFKVEPWKFVALDSAGAAIWSGTFLLAGWEFRDQLERVAVYLTRFGVSMGVIAGAGLAIYIAFRYLERQRVFRSLRIARITPVELKQRLDAGENITIIDLRNAFEASEGRIPGSIVVSDDALDSLASVDYSSGIVFYCSCPNEVSSARAALRLKRRGIEKVRPLEGGYPLWVKSGFPVEVTALLATTASG